uniref:Rhodanese domain-containing protein n=1 Tax=Grammatophora oceanica TaxID=210454 RepID=A0A7S1UYQ5_9STRA|mmetsp:Transcript_30058/g.44376  ORF Transcript_30058/g.44376 Transcript_30058/m.44376 type:complete len:121 (+) Transcript_30058:201-563(+)|eukprot:CAMPEP_0194054414 /NCGR_PEP_ID=MMETSP0009_2-20130614/53313_1 /TAXON_ID=210454 /ORGANISM="Grammatophora oceanica, Strain CCMP 410" /LENGTH=120 /DNA_ID=CAMNT_0038702881 /DNA_START=115 /DNA_END=477 /DNA_ORIENTATION=-
MSNDYETRAAQYGFATQDQVLAAMSDEKTILLDVRTQEEIAGSGKVKAQNWAMTKCTPSTCPALEKDPSDIVGDDKDVTIVVYCRSGRRASQAKSVLQEKGYAHVLNAGGLKDLTYLEKE